MSSLESINGKLHLNGAPYTGVTFESVHHHRFKAIEVNNGLVVGSYKPAVNDSGIEQPIGIDVSDFPVGEEPLIVNGKKYNGLAFSFENNFCDAEYLFKNGNPQIEFLWNKNGKLTHYMNALGAIMEEYDWHEENLHLASISVRAVGGFDGMISFDKNGGIRSFSGNDGFFKNFKNLRSSTKFFPFSDIMEILQHTAAPRVSISGNDVNANFMRQWIERGGLKDTSSIMFPAQILLQLIQELKTFAQSLTEIILPLSDRSRLQEIKNAFPDAKVS